ncbi:MAG: methylmalonyl Co-A mutase-associated GTPase MeaB [Flavobacteriales bacterium]
MSSQKMSSKNKAVDAARKRIQSNRTEGFNASEIAAAIVEGKREELAKAITLIESENPSDRPLAQELLQAVKDLSSGKETLRVGITGIPGVGKSTFIERLGLDMIKDGDRVAVLAVDPSSKKTGGSILGDKTRMDELAVHSAAFVRPSPAASALGGVARATMEAVILCEAAGYNKVIVETVGVGQSETSVREMVDVFTLLLIGGAGDEVQGIKRGIVEMADLIVVHKADGDRIDTCMKTAQSYRNSLHLFPMPDGGEVVEVMTASSITGAGHHEVKEHIASLAKNWRKSGFFIAQRSNQQSDRMFSHAKDILLDKKMGDPSSKADWEVLSQEVKSGKQSAFSAAWSWVYKTRVS